MDHGDSSSVDRGAGDHLAWPANRVEPDAQQLAGIFTKDDHGTCVADHMWRVFMGDSMSIR